MHGEADRFCPGQHRQVPVTSRALHAQIVSSRGHVFAENYSCMSNGTDFLIIAPLQDEREALLDLLLQPRLMAPDNLDTRVYHLSELPVERSDGSRGSYRLTVTSPLDMGLVEAATATSDAIRRFGPRYVLLVGIAGGVGEKIQLGDLLIADQLVDYEHQKLTSDRPEVRYRAHRTDARLVAWAQNFRSFNFDAVGSRPEPGTSRRHVGPIITGNKVMASVDALAVYRADWPNLIGVEMEAGGVASAAFEAAAKPGVLTIRGVSDLADKDKNKSQADGWRDYACRLAAAYAVAFLRSGPVPFADVGSAGALSSSSSAIRDKLQNLLRTSSDFDAFCLDYFPSVYRQFASGMNRVERTTLLFSSAKLADIEAALARMRR